MSCGLAWYHSFEIPDFGRFGVYPNNFAPVKLLRINLPTVCDYTSVYKMLLSTFPGALDFEHIEEQAEGIFGGRKVYFLLPICR